jgi:hypothetical protein
MSCRWTIVGDLVRHRIIELNWASLEACLNREWNISYLSILFSPELIVCFVAENTNSEFN